MKIFKTVFSHFIIPISYQLSLVGNINYELWSLLQDRLVYKEYATVYYFNHIALQLPLQLSPRRYDLQDF